MHAFLREGQEADLVPIDQHLKAANTGFGDEVRHPEFGVEVGGGRVEVETVAEGGVGPAGRIRGIAVAKAGQDPGDVVATGDAHQAAYVVVGKDLFADRAVDIGTIQFEYSLTWGAPPPPAWGFDAQGIGLSDFETDFRVQGSLGASFTINESIAARGTRTPSGQTPGATGPPV